MTLEVSGALCLDDRGKDKKQSFKKGQLDDADVRFVSCTNEIPFVLYEVRIENTGDVDRRQCVTGGCMCGAFVIVVFVVAVVVVVAVDATLGTRAMWWSRRKEGKNKGGPSEPRRPSL